MVWGDETNRFGFFLIVKAKIKMKKITVRLAVINIFTVLFFADAKAGNPDRAGQAGANELLVNSWARSSGWNGANTSGIRGLESMQLNVAGLAFTPKTEMIFARTNWLAPSGININSFGFAQTMGDAGTIGLQINSWNFGDIERTTVQNPEGGIGTFSPQFINLGFGYAKRFSSTISGGLVARVINEAIEDVRASGVAVDAGVQYVTSSKPGSKSIKKDDIKFGVSVRNIGPDMSYRGDGMAQKARILGNDYDNTLQNRSASFNLPSMLMIGASYDFRLDKDTNTYFHRLTMAGTFISHSFQQNQVMYGLEYGYKNFLMFRAGYAFENGIFDELGPGGRQSALTGFAGGFSIDVPLSKQNKNTFGFDYSYRSTNPFNGIHTFGLRINLADLD